MTAKTDDLRRRVRDARARLESMAHDLDTARTYYPLPLTVWQGYEHREQVARAQLAQAEARLDHELWWHAVMADPRIGAYEEGEAQASLRACGAWR